MSERRIRDGDGTPEAEWERWPGLRRLPAITAAEIVPVGRRAVVVAPHPDDEVLAVGGLLAQLARLEREMLVIALTDGSASHPGSALWTEQRLARERPAESRRALALLGVRAPCERLRLPDGGLSALGDLLSDAIASRCREHDVVISTWRLDGHPDHEATGYASSIAAARVGAALFEVPVWGWHWARPGDLRVPWRRARRLMLDPDAVRRKCQAVQAFRSQLLPDDSTGRGAVLRRSTLQRAARGFEVLFA